MFDRNNIYASISRGRRPGAVSVLPAETTYLQPEIIWSYETGIKGNVVNGKHNCDFTMFYYDWNHFQTTSLKTIEGSLTPKSQADDAGKVHSFGIETGLRYRFLYQLSAFANYAYINGKFNNKDEDGNPELLSQDGYGLFHYTARVGFKLDKKAYCEISTYGKNAFDKKYIIDAGNRGNTIGMPTFVGGSPSQLGVQIKVGF